MSIAIGTYVAFEQRTGAVTISSFQNFHAGETRTYEGVDYTYAAFGFSGAAVDVQSANTEATLVFAVNQLSLSLFTAAADDFYVARIKTVWLDPATLAETNQRLEEVYAVTGYDHDSSRLTLRLSSPLDSVGRNVPRRTLNQRIVGALPSTGNISFI